MLKCFIRNAWNVSSYEEFTNRRLFNYVSYNLISFFGPCSLPERGKSMNTLMKHTPPLGPPPLFLIVLPSLLCLSGLRLYWSLLSGDVVRRNKTIPESPNPFWLLKQKLLFNYYKNIIWQPSSSQKLRFMIIFHLLHLWIIFITFMVSQIITFMFNNLLYWWWVFH